MNETIDWDKIIKKEARGLDDYDLGEVQEFDEEFVITKKGVVDKDKFYLPRSRLDLLKNQYGFKVQQVMTSGQGSVGNPTTVYILMTK
jgi:hypothetical protein